MERNSNWFNALGWSGSRIPYLVDNRTTAATLGEMWFEVEKILEILSVSTAVRR